MFSIEDIIKQDFIRSGRSYEESSLLARSMYNEYTTYKHLLDPDFDTTITKAGTCKDNASTIEVKRDRLTELAYTKFLASNFHSISNPNGKNGLDIKLDDINCWGEYKSIRLGEAGNGKSDFISRLTNALSKKFVMVQKNRNANSSAKNYIADNQPVILFFELDKKVLLTFKDVLLDDAKSDYLPIYLQALFPVDNFCNECELIIDKKTGKCPLERRYFADKILKLKDNGTEWICDGSAISAVVFSETITSILFESGLDDEWDNDLIMIHNPFARNPVKEFLFPTWYEYRCTVDEKEHKFTVTEIHPKNT